MEFLWDWFHRIYDVESLVRVGGLAALTAKALPGYDRHIFEIHHKRKKDSPSGTALRLADRVREVVNEDTLITALRMGDVTGEHTLIFGGPGERLEIVHHADSRAHGVGGDRS